MLTRIISKFGFPLKLNALVLGCISTEFVELLLSGSAFDKVEMERRLTWTRFER